MGFNRRQVLVLGGATLGIWSGACAHKLLLASGDAPSASTTISDFPESTPTVPASPQVAIGPTGMVAPLRGDVRLVVISDLNSQYGSTSYRQEVSQGVQLIPDWQPDLVLCAGDMVAGQRLSLSRSQLETMWVAFGNQIVDPIRQAGLPLAFTMGNHDASSSRSGGSYVFAQERDVAQTYWHSPQRLGLDYVDQSGYPFYYAFQQNDIFYLVWDASSATISTAELAWAERLLSSDMAQAAKMRIVMGHLPFYAVSQGRDRAGEILNNAEATRALLERLKVHTYISGHQHAYYPSYMGQLQLLHCGALGSGPRTWLNRTDAPMQTLTVMDIFFDPLTTVYTTYNMATRTVVELSQIPRQIVGPTGRLLRRDLTWNDLSEAERKQTYVASGN